MAGMSQLSASASADSVDGEGGSVSPSTSLGGSVGKFCCVGVVACSDSDRDGDGTGTGAADVVGIVFGCGLVIMIAAFVVVVVVVVVVVAGGGGELGVVVGRGTDRCVVIGGSAGSEQTHSEPRSPGTQPQFSPSCRHWDAMHDWPFAIVMNDNNSNATNAMTKQNIFGIFRPLNL